MGIGKFLGSISPAYGAITGKGAFGNALAAIGDTGMGGLAAMQAKAARDKRRARRADEAAGQEEAAMRAKVRSMDSMKKGGKVKKMAHGGSASKRADGIAQKGKTKGRMV